jgi:4-amino-4-deoxy-L-arabinose transferase-like glycosyltransferase
VWWLSVAAVACLGIFLVFYELNDYRTLTKHEGFVAVVSREMLNTGDWIVPQFGGLPRLKKPPLAYWCAATVSYVTGEHAPWTARLPFAISALLLAGLVGVWAGKWYGRWAGLAAALIQISSVYVISFSRKAEVDMLLCLLTTSALFLVANGPRDEAKSRRGLRWIAIYALVGLSWLAKFHYGPAMVLSVIAVWLLLDRRRPSVWDVLNPIGLSILAAAVVIWPWLLLQRLPEAWDIWRIETVGRALGHFGSHALWYYLPQVIIQSLPWSVLLWKAGRESFRRAWQAGDQRERFLWVWFITQFVILSASAFKHHHYLMAALPALSLILGRQFALLWSNLRNGSVQITGKQIVGLAGLVIAVGVAAAVGIAETWPNLAATGIAVAVCWIATGLFASYCLAKQFWTSYLGTMGLGLLACYAILMTMIFPHRDSRLPYVEFAQDVRREIPDGNLICVYGLKEDPLVYYLDVAAIRAESAGELRDQVAVQGSLLLITDEAHLRELAAAGYQVERKSGPQSETEDSPPLVLVRMMPHAFASRRPKR